VRATDPERPVLTASQRDRDLALDRAMRRLLAREDVEYRGGFSSLAHGRLHYLDAGTGLPLLLLHGASGGGANWYRLIAPLARQRRVLAPDLPGFGFSDASAAAHPLGRHVARIMAEWLHSLGIQRVDVAGTSFGGLVALRLPEYFDVRRLVIIDSVGLSRRLPLLLRLGTLPILARLAASPSRRGTRALLRYVFTASRLPAEHEAALLDYLYYSARRGDPAAMARALVLFAGWRGQRDVVEPDRLRALGPRLLLVWGERDAFLPINDAQRACALAGCRAVHIIPGAGHSPNWERPELVRKAITEHLENEQKQSEGSA
jgi:pimeloyl-ACP methyl ester carboxylesterase